jgi:cytidyltransferase-like protein
MVTVFVSGCYDVLHGGHIEFFKQARALGDRLVVCFAADAVLRAHKLRAPAMPEDHKRAILETIRYVDEVVMGAGEEIGLDFKDHFLRIRPQILAATEDDKYEQQKLLLCMAVGARYVKLPKTLPFEPISTTAILRRVRTPMEVPLRVDMAGGWLDVPRLALEGAYVVNCAISPKVSLGSWPYQIGAGLGGSAARAMLVGENPVTSELDAGVGWQDPAIIRETGLCAWKSGPRPVLELKVNPEFLMGRMALLWTGQSHMTPSLVNRDRDYHAIAYAGLVALEAARARSLGKLVEAVSLSYDAQLGEGMAQLPAHGEQAKKYCGGGWGGYALYLFGEPADRDQFVARIAGARPIEPYMT